MSKYVTGKVKFSYVNLSGAMDPGQDAAYSVCLEIPEGEQLQEIREAISDAVQEGIAAAWDGRRPERLRMPLRQDPDGRYYINAASHQRPGVMDRKSNAVDPGKGVSGCQGRASLTFFPYRSGSSCGIGAGLNNIQLLSF